jgi:uncharacterized protein Yka (UPF0111/DUF47 family)
MQSEIFFIISSVGFVTLWILVAILLFYLIRISRKFSKIVDKVEKNVDDISDTARDMFLEIKESSIFKFIFGKSKRGRKEK